jgi:integrase
VPLSTVSPATITKYFTSAVAGRWKRTTISFHVYSLRSFFRYATNRGWCAAGIAESIDAPRVYTYENLPQGPAWEEVRKLVTRVNGTSPVQIRSRCAILLCSVYGLRAGEVSCLRLEDIDWAEERISVRRPKQRKAQTTARSRLRPPPLYKGRRPEAAIESLVERYRRARCCTVLTGCFLPYSGARIFFASQRYHRARPVSSNLDRATEFRSSLPWTIPNSLRGHNRQER